MESPPLHPVPAARLEPESAPRVGVLRRMRIHWADYMYVLPSLVVMLIVIGYPLVYTIYLSFFDTPPSSGDRIFDGIGNYTTILKSERFWNSTRNTFNWTVWSTLFAFIIGFGAALVVQKQFIGRGILRGIFLIPWVISQVAAAYVWRWLYHSDYGLISGMLMKYNILEERFIFLDSTTWVMPSLIVANVWKEFPFVMIMMLAGLQTVPDQLLRAARIDGANSINQFIHITVPHLKNIIVVTVLLLFVANLNSFGLVWIMTGGGPAGASQIWIIEIYTLAFRSLQFGLASAFSVILFILMMGLGYFYVRALTTGRTETERT